MRSLKILLCFFYLWATQLIAVPTEKFHLHILSGEGGIDKYQDCILRAFLVDRGLTKSWDITFYDTQSDELVVASLGKKLKTVKKVDLVFGNLTSQGAIILGDILADTSIPFLVANASNPKVTEGKPNVTRYSPDSGYYAEMYQIFVRDLDAKNIYILSNLSKTYSVYYADKMEKGLKARKRNFFRKDFITGQDVFKEVAKDVVKRKVDLVYAPIYQASFLQLITALSEQKFQGTVLTHESAISRFFGKTAFPVYVNSGVASNEEGRNKVYEQLHKKFCAEYEMSDFVMTAAASLDSVALLENVLAVSPSARGNVLSKKLQETSFHGFAGSRIFRNGRIETPAYFIRFQGGVAQFYKKLEADNAPK